MRKSIVLLSGGQDSTLCLAMARATDQHNLHTIAFDYGQRHRVELAAAKWIASYYGVPHRVIEIPDLATGDNALVDHGRPIDDSGPLPNTFVRGRNLLFLSYAVALGGTDITIGANAVDFSGYPDCRPEFLSSFNKAAEEAVEERVMIHTPLLHMSKREIAMLCRIHVPNNVMAKTVTCYKGTHCGVCPSCKLRSEGYAKAGLRDPAA